MSTHAWRLPLHALVGHCYINYVDQQLKEYCGEDACWGADNSFYGARTSRTCLRLPSRRGTIESGVSDGRSKDVKIRVSNNVTALLSGA
jgi:hypothetical protein